MLEGECSRDFLEKLSSSTSSKALQPKCDCDDGFEGQGCEIQVCPGNKNCNNHGTCNRKDLSCVCEHGWEGVGCTVPTFCPNKCSNHGKCTEDGCHCDMGWEGKACALKACPQQCNGNGVCSNGVCACNGNFTGPSCDIRQCDNNCTGHGTCLTDLLVCKCEDGWNGPSCEIKWCKGGCGGAHGTCDPSGLTHDLPVCKCLADWGGASCQVPCSMMVINVWYCMTYAIVDVHVGFNASFKQRQTTSRILPRFRSTTT